MIINPYNIAKCLNQHRPEKIDDTRQYWSLLCIYMADFIRDEGFFEGLVFDKDKFLDICHGIQQ